MRRFLACLMSIVLVVGLLPAIPSSAWAGALTVSGGAPEGAAYAEPTGLQLNAEPLALETWSYPSEPERYGIIPSYLEGGVALTFEGSVPPRLAIGLLSGSALATIYANDATSLVWKDEAHTAGVIFYDAATIEAAVAASDKGTMDDARRVFPQADEEGVTVNRVVLPGVDPLPDVSDGNYGDDTVRRLYTRPVAIKTAPDSGEKLCRSTAIDIFNPIYDGASFAVRYTCPEGKEATPYLQLCHVTSDNQWIGWTSMDATWGARTAIDAETGERVTFYDRAELERLWSDRGGKSGDEYDHVYLCVHPQSAAYPEGSEEVDLVEVVALGGAERVQLTDAQLHKVSGHSAAEVARDMKAGYNMAGHFESNYVPDSSKDGGWGQADLALEGHWASGTYVTRETIHGLKENGFNTVRLPVTWFQHIYPAGDPTGSASAHMDMTPVERYHIDRAWMERVHEVVDWCIAEDMYVIVNMHHEDWIDRTDLATAYDDPTTDLPAKFKAVWTQIGNEFAGYDQRLVFEDMNEPHAWYYETNADGSYKLDADGAKITNWGYASEGSVATVNKLNADFVKLMREELSGHGERLLMLAHDTGNGEISYTGFEMPADAAGLVAHSIHCYTPHDWTHYLMHAPEGETGKDNSYTAQFRKDVEAQWELIRSRYTARGEAVVLGEFGCFYQWDPDDDARTAELQQDRLDWMTQYATHAKELGIPLVYWRMDRSATGADGKKHQLWSAFDEETHELSPLSSHLFEKWFSILDDDGIAWGSLAKVDAAEHVALDDAGAVQLAPTDGWPKTIAGLHNATKDWYVGLSNVGPDNARRLTWDDVDGKEIAVKFTGPTPRLGAVQEDWGGDYWGGAPDVVDYDNGIAYWRAESIATRWNAVVDGNAASANPDARLLGSTVENISRIYVVTATSGASPATAADLALSTTVEQVAILPNAWVQTTAPTCTEPGVKSCESASGTLTRLIPATGHAWDTGKVTTQAGPVKKGAFTYTCANCGETRTESIPATGRLKMSDAKISLSSSSLVYNGSERKPTVTVKSSDGKKTLKANTDYKLTYLRSAKETKDLKSVGTVTVKVTALNTGDYTGSKTTTYKITKKSITPAVALSKTGYVYTGKALKPAVTVWADSKKKSKVPTAGYSVAYKNNTNPGKATVTVTAKGNYTFKTKTLSFTINPKPTTVSKVVAAKRGFTAKWKKQAAQAGGYQLQYAPKSSFKSGARTVTVAGAKTVSRKVTGLKAKAKYWVRVRTYKKASGKTYYSTWSKAKAVTTKK